MLIYNGYATGRAGEGEELGYADESDTDAIIAYRQRYPHPTSYKLKYPWNLKVDFHDTWGIWVYSG